MSGNRKLTVAKRFHETCLILRHGPKAVCLMLRVTFRLGAVAISTQIAHYHRKMLCKSISNFSPHQMGLGIAMQQQKRLALSANSIGNLNPCRNLSFLKSKSVKHW
jgi:hypothetical protein